MINAKEQQRYQGFINNRRANQCKQARRRQSARVHAECSTWENQTCGRCMQGDTATWHVLLALSPVYLNVMSKVLPSQGVPTAPLT